MRGILYRNMTRASQLLAAQDRAIGRTLPLNLDSAND
jgi:hypothetical protein